MAETVAQAALDFAGRKLDQLASRICDCLGRLNDEQVWARAGDEQNAVGNLVLHLCGNVRQWVVSGIGGQIDVRQRDAEFATRGGLPRDELAERLARTASEARAVLNRLPESRLLEKITVQAYELTVMEAVLHVVEHFAQHTGQIIFATKLLTGEDLGYYAHLSRPKHGQTTP